MMDRIVGIDLGTTNSRGVYARGEPRRDPGRRWFESCSVSCSARGKNGQPVIGNAARNSLIASPERAVYTSSD